MPIEIDWKFYNSIKNQWKSIGNQVEISIKYQLKSIGNQVEFSMKYDTMLDLEGKLFPKRFKFKGDQILV